MTTITFPSSPRPATMAWRLTQPAQVNISGWTGKRQVAASGRGWWECEIVFPPIVGTDSYNQWRAFLALARGAANDFQVPYDPTPQSTLPHTVLTNGANQTGRAIVTDGWPASSTVLRPGNAVTINGQLLQVTNTVVSNGSGQATINVEPAVREPVADNSAVEFRNPYAVMYLADTPASSVEPGYVYNLSLSLREAF